MSLRMKARVPVQLAGPWLGRCGTRTLGSRATSVPPSVLPFEALPQHTFAPWARVLSMQGQSWESLHLEMHQAFQELGPIFRSALQAWKWSLPRRPRGP